VGGQLCLFFLVQAWASRGCWFARTYPPLSTHMSVFFSSELYSQNHARSIQNSQVPVKILCGHDCSLCAPPTASSVFCPGFKPLCNMSAHVRRSFFLVRPCSLPAKAVGTVGAAYRWYVLFKHNRQLVSSSCFGVRPFSEACVATGMKIGN
jgi:hypothetical protein